MNNLARLTSWLTSTKSQRLILKVLRKYKPVLSVLGRTVVTRHADVVEVLSRDQDFLIAPVNAPKLDALNLHFLLAMDASDEHTHEFQLLHSIVHREDAQQIRQLVQEKAAECLQFLSTTNRIEIVHSFNLPVINYLLDKYFGVMDGDLEPQIMDNWMRILFHQSFLNLGNNKQVEQAALTASRELETYLLRLIGFKREALKANQPLEDNLLNRLITTAEQPENAWITDDVIRRQISGLIIGAVDTTSKCVVHVLDELFRWPAQFRMAVNAALNNDVDKITRFCWEALWFNPHNPLIMRYSRANVEIGGNNQGKMRFIKKGNTVFAFTLSAMFDEEVFSNPTAFRTDRPTEYLHFGYGMHQCYGRHINAITIPEMTSALLRLPSLRRVAGKKAKPVYDGPFPESFVLEFDQPRNKVVETLKRTELNPIA